MRILLATYFIAPHVGGVWEYMMQVKQRFERLGHTVDLFSSGPGHMSYHMPNLNRVLDKEALRPLLYAKINGEYYPELTSNWWLQHFEFECITMELAAAYFGLHDYDIIHAQDVYAARAFSRIRPAKTPLIASLHGSVAEEYRLHFLENNEDIHHSLKWKYQVAVEHIGAISSDVTITSTQWLRNKLIQEFAVPPEQIRVFQYGYDLDGFSAKMSLPSPIARPPHQKVLLFTGRLVEIKGVHVLLQALAILKNARQDWVCWIVGEGEAEVRLKQQAADLGLSSHVIFWGKRTDVAFMLTLADIFVCPSLLDNQPLSLIEAQIAGLPSVVSSAGGIPEMVSHSQTGYIFTSGQSYELYAYLILLLNDHKLRAEMGEAARQWANAHWSYDQMILRLLAIYHEYLSVRS